MPNTRDIRRRIRSVRSTAQITKAMQMVASSKMRKAQEAALVGRPYVSLMAQVLAAVSDHAGDFAHPLMEVRPGSRRAVIVVASDKGLCGALNSNLLREAAKLEVSVTQFIAVGRRAAQFIARTKRQLLSEFSCRDTPLYSEARAISRFARKLFLDSEVDSVDVLFTQFVSTLSQRPRSVPLLPVGEVKSLVAKLQPERALVAHQQAAFEFLFEPSPEAVLTSLLPHYLNYVLYQILLEAKASEHSARMVAMKNATDNAQELLQELSLEYNKLRQAIITREFLELTTAALTLE